jgi:hypothetical protein
MGWQPIETAPKRGGFERLLLRFDGYFFDPSQKGIAVGFWGSRGGWVVDCIWASSDAHHAPTHWMPLPEPPKAT